MELFTVTITTTSDEAWSKFHSQMEQEFADLHMQPEGVTFTESRNSHEYQIICHGILPGFKLTQHAPKVYSKAANVLAEYILEIKERAVLRRIIRKEFHYKRSEDLDKIETYCMELLQETNEEFRTPDDRERRKRLLVQEITQYFEENTALHVEGFIRFRLDAYTKELRDIVEYAVDEYILDQQYHEFIALLKYFVFVQETKIPVAHVMHRGDHQFVLLNDQMRPIETKQMTSVVVEMPDHDIEVEDMIVSTLITVSPQKIYIHTREPELQVIKTIQQIFESRAQLCVYCPVCSPYLSESAQQHD
ncbi:putative sporulation protein YtxC [Paenibacillus sp. GCM10027629]|uniref:putative sporulation protein YtxC n=1 Tax=Paenibacillus sp. GCM10027629 TaxID=3273414 RepID=UPI003633F2EA